MADPYRVLTTGSRSVRDADPVTNELHRIALSVGWKRLVVVHGDCPDGGDRLVKLWCDRMGVATDPRPADWERYGKPAGGIRDREMVQLGAETCVAQIERCIKPGCEIRKRHGSHGATTTAELAEQAGIPTWRWTNLTLPDFRTEELF